MATRSNAVERFLAAQPLKMYVGGEWVEAADCAAFEVLDPGSGVRVAMVSSGGRPDVDRAVQSARGAFEGPWSTMPAAERARLLHRLSELIQSRAEVLSEIESL